MVETHDKRGYVLAVPPPCAVGWTCDWPPTARPGVLIACDRAPGYFTHKTMTGLPILFTDGAGFPADRQIDPSDGLLVWEVDRHGNERFAVVRRIADADSPEPGV